MKKQIEVRTMGSLLRPEVFIEGMGVIGEYSIEREGVIIREKAREYPEIAYFPEVVKCKKPNIANKIKSLLIMRK